ncbi:MAG TPA: VOC family protein [Bacillota bacterium]|jgi:catechol 2,3-dioxygenase-like lactoylglutathione lyase family enzyme
MITGIGHICIGVSDLDRAVEFYTTKLGFSAGRRVALPGGAVLVGLKPPGLDTEGTELELYFNPADPTGRLRHIGLVVGDVWKAAAQLREMGVDFHRDPPPQDAIGAPAIAFFRDPDGVEIEILEEGD